MSLADEAREARQAAEELNGVFGSMRETLRANAKELGAFTSNAKEAKGLYTQLDGQLRKLQSQEEGITRLTDKQLKDIRAKSQEQVSEIKQRAESLAQERGLSQLSGEQLIKAAQRLENAGKISEAESSLLQAKAANFDIEEESLNLIEEELALREESNSLLGVSGNILKGIEGSLGSFAKAFKLDQVAKDMEKAADEAVKLNKSFGKTRVLIAGIKAAGKGLVQTVSDPSVLMGALIKGFNEVDKANVEFQRSIGQSANTATSSFAAMGSTAITLADYIKTAGTLTKELGQDATGIFGPEDIVEASEMVEAMGMTGKEAANLAKYTKINGINLETQNKAMVEGVKAANKQNKTAVATGDVLKDVANVSDDIAISYAGYPGKLASAATTAKSLGMTLADIDKISGSLLNFQSSIEKEMEAELLTGRQLNLEKARQLALDNDLEGVAIELTKQGITSTNFSKMNRIQQEAQAAALGMQRDEMAKMLLSQELGKNLSEDALNDAQKATLEQLKTQEAAEAFQKAIDGLSQAFAPFVGMIAGILNNKAGLLAIQGIILAIVGAKAVSGITKMASEFSGLGKTLKGLGSGASGIAKYFKEAYKNGGLLGKMYKGGQFMPGGGRAAAGGERGGGILGSIKGAAKRLMGGGDKTSEATDAANSASSIEEPSDNGESLKEKMQNIAEGIKSFASMEVIGGALAMTIAAPGLVVLGLASIPLKLTERLDGEAIESGMTGIANGIKSFANAQVIIGGLALVPISLALATMAVGAIGLGAIALLGAPAAAGMTALTAGLTALGAAAATGVPFLGVALIATFGAALIPFGYALGLAAPAIEAVGTTIATIIMGIAQAVVTVMPALTQSLIDLSNNVNLAGLFGLALALPSLAGGALILASAMPAMLLASISLLALGASLNVVAMAFEKMAGANTEGLVTSIAQFVALAPGLAATAAALFAVAGGLGAMAIAGVAALPVMAGLAVLGTVATGISSILGGEDEEGETSTPANNDNAILAAKLDQMNATLNAILTKEGTVMLDSTKVGTALTVGTYKLQ